LGSQHFSYNDELLEGVKMWLSKQAADFLDNDIQKLILQYDKCLNGSDYVEKQLKYIHIHAFLYIITFFLSVLLTARWRLLSEQTSYPKQFCFFLYMRKPSMESIITETMTLATNDLPSQLPVNAGKVFFLLIHIKVSLMKGLVKLQMKTAVNISKVTKNI
jgi:hypothetical protein